MVPLSGSNFRIRKVQMVLMTSLKLYGPVFRLMTWKPRVQEVIRRIRRGPHCASVRGPSNTQTALPWKVYDRVARRRPAH